MEREKKHLPNDGLGYVGMRAIIILIQNWLLFMRQSYQCFLCLVLFCNGYLLKFLTILPISETIFLSY